MKVTMLVTSFYQWLKANSVLLLNAGSLVSTTAVTSVFGFAFWWFAARLFPPAEVGLASAAVSAMILIGTVSTLGLGTLLIGELARQPGQEISLISAALLVVLFVGTCVGGLFACVAPLISVNFLPLRASVWVVLFFGLGCGLTAVTMVLDQALIGLLLGSWQLWRNAIFAVAKLVVLILAGLLLFHRIGMAIFAAWVAGFVCSLLALGYYALLKIRVPRKEHMPQWRLLGKLGPAAFQHYALNMILQAPDQLLPVMVTAMLSATVNAGFYIASMLANFVYVGSNALTTVLYATASNQPANVAEKARLTIGVALMACAAANIVLLLGGTQLLALFGHTYASQASLSLRILGLAAFPLIIKNHYTACCRIQKRLAQALLPLAASSTLELVISALGAYVGGLTGLSLGWLLAVTIEAVFMFRPVYAMVRPQVPQVMERIS